MFCCDVHIKDIVIEVLALCTCICNEGIEANFNVFFSFPFLIVLVAMFACDRIRNSVLCEDMEALYI